MLLVNNTLLLIVSTIIAVFMATTMIFIRVRIAQKPTSVKKIILPPILMSTGALIFLSPIFRISPIEIMEAAILGIIFSIFLVKTTKFEIRKNEIYLIPSKSFIFILLGLIIARTIIKLMIGSTVSFGQTSGMFFILGFFMIVTWRLSMLYKYQKLKKQIDEKKHTC